MTWLQASIIQKVRTFSLYILLNINLFLQQNFSTKTCHIMIPKDRDFNKDSKKIFICYFRIFLQITINFQSSLQKGNNKTRNCRWVPEFTLGSLERNQTLQSGPSPDREQRSSAGEYFRRVEARRGRGKLGEKERELVRTSG